MEGTREVTQCTGSIWMALRMKLQYIALAGKCPLEVRKRSEVLKTGIARYSCTGPLELYPSPTVLLRLIEVCSHDMLRLEGGRSTQ